jgi:hypothetical protein
MTNDKIQDRSTPRFVMINHCILDMGLTTEAFRVYAELKKFANHETQECFPSYSKLSAVFKGSYPDAHESTLRKKAIASVQELIDRGLLIKEKRTQNETSASTSNLYILTPPTDWKTTASLTPSLSHKKRPNQRTSNKNCLGSSDSTLPGSDSEPPFFPDQVVPTRHHPSSDSTPPGSESSTLTITSYLDPINNTHLIKNEGFDLLNQMTIKNKEEREEESLRSLGGMVVEEETQVAPIHSSPVVDKKEIVGLNEELSVGSNSKVPAAPEIIMTTTKEKEPFGLTKYDRWAENAHPALVFSGDETPWLSQPTRVQFTVFDKGFIEWGGDRFAKQFSKDIFQARGDFMASLKNDPDKILMRWDEYAAAKTKPATASAPVGYRAESVPNPTRKVNLPHTRKA